MPRAKKQTAKPSKSTTQKTDPVGGSRTRQRVSKAPQVVMSPEVESSEEETLSKPTIKKARKLRAVPEVVIPPPTPQQKRMMKTAKSLIDDEALDGDTDEQSKGVEEHQDDRDFIDDRAEDEMTVEEDTNSKQPHVNESDEEAFEGSMAKQPVQSKGKGKAVEPRFTVNDDVHTVSDSEEVETPPRNKGKGKVAVERLDSKIVMPGIKSKTYHIIPNAQDMLDAGNNPFIDQDASAADPIVGKEIQVAASSSKRTRFKTEHQDNHAEHGDYVTDDSPSPKKQSRGTKDGDSVKHKEEHDAVNDTPVTAIRKGIEAGKLQIKSEPSSPIKQLHNRRAAIPSLAAPPRPRIDLGSGAVKRQITIPEHSHYKYATRFPGAV